MAEVRGMTTAELGGSGNSGASKDGNILTPSTSDDKTEKFMKAIELLLVMPMKLGIYMAAAPIAGFIGFAQEIFGEANQLYGDKANEIKDNITNTVNEATEKIQNGFNKDSIKDALGIEEALKDPTNRLEKIRYDIASTIDKAIDESPLIPEAEEPEPNIVRKENSKGELVDIDQNVIDEAVENAKLENPDIDPERLEAEIIDSVPTVKEDAQFQAELQVADANGMTAEQSREFIDAYSETMDIDDPEVAREARSEITETLKEANEKAKGATEYDYSDVADQAKNITNQAKDSSMSTPAFGLAQNVVNVSKNAKEFEDDPAQAQVDKADNLVSTTKNSYILIARAKNKLQTKEGQENTLDFHKEEERFNKELSEQTKELKNELKQREQELLDGKFKEGVTIDGNGEPTKSGQPNSIEMNIEGDKVEMSLSKTEKGLDKVDVKLNGKSSSIDEVTAHFEGKTKDAHSKAGAMDRANGVKEAGAGARNIGDATKAVGEATKGAAKGAEGLIKGGTEIMKGIKNIGEKIAKLLKEALKSGIKVGTKTIPYVNIITTALEAIKKVGTFGRDNAKVAEQSVKKSKNQDVSL